MTSPPFPPPSDLARHWAHDPAVCYLNHGSYGSCPAAVLEDQARLRRDMESDGVRFFTDRLTPMMDESRRRLAAFINCDWHTLAFLPNETTATATVLHNLDLEPGDEILVTDHEYPACCNIIARAAQRAGAKLTIASIPWPIASQDDAVSAILGAVTPRTRLALISHVTSPTGLILPIKRIVAQLKAHGVETLVDGAHTVGFTPLDIDAIGAAYYAGNLHKWLCTPKGAAFLHVRPDLQENFRPLVLSNRAFKTIPGRSRFLVDFDYIGTDDYTAALVIPGAIDHMASLISGGWPAIMERNRDLALTARDLLCKRLGSTPPAPDTMLGPMAAVPLPGQPSDTPTRFADPLQDVLVDQWRIQAPIIRFPGHADLISPTGRPFSRHVRISAQLYNSIAQYEYLAIALETAESSPL